MPAALIPRTGICFEEKGLNINIYVKTAIPGA